MESEEHELYSIGEVAERLGLHVRTVRNYVRDGRLKAVRIGKQYRISRADFEALTSRSAAGAPSVPAVGRGHVEVSSIVQIDGIGPDAAHRLSTFVTASAQSPRDTPDPLRVQTVHDRERARMKIVILGGAAATAELLQLIDGVLGPENGMLDGGQEAHRA
ncbi:MULTISPECIES: helix-turn-helix domain-containing protein [Streptomyces]|uniref:Helix-turn-helix domain-containing protein n=1 Tax=Streptomyces microflavus TaxID=1919 RepID=A0A6N9VLJ5_STRMI|nr:MULTISPECIES: helix-turn-helix domain-containing protein [Streptomyces]MBK5993995.1 helix-turn-helix domain-containing protein [Streptomyces sp. MBT58]NEB73187.1 helix-turn-helix domain-containing protein [Streptomyces microflavus]QQZ57928.1 helix-turn-helix domain-containing protein [Streptomyces microflavus]